MQDLLNNRCRGLKSPYVSFFCVLVHNRVYKIPFRLNSDHLKSPEHKLVTSKRRNKQPQQSGMMCRWIRARSPRAADQATESAQVPVTQSNDFSTSSEIAFV